MAGLFRRQVLQARQDACFGRVVLRPPVSFTVWCALASVLAAAVVALLVFGQYTRRARIVGVTVPAAGVLKLTASQPGIVVERRVEEGQQVRAGQVLFVLSSERITEATGVSRSAQTVILEQLQRRRASLDEERARQMRLLDEQTEATRRRRTALQLEAAQLQRELVTHAAREASAADQHARYEELSKQGFVSPSAARQRRDERLEHTARRQALERNLLALQREIGAVGSELQQIPLRAEQQRAGLQRELAALEQDIVSAEVARKVVVTAPQAGVITAIVAERGQFVGPQPLATLLPSASPMEAHLFAPSRAVGFVEPGQAVRVRFAAYPYQKFGQYHGEVMQVARSALAPAELPPQLSLIPPAEPLYRITVRLAAPYVTAYGRVQPLTAGMQLEADVMQDRRRLIQWVFEPLIALTGRI